MNKKLLSILGLLAILSLVLVSCGGATTATTPEEVVVKETVVVDANHPLAGRPLHFEVSVEEVREPTAEELQQTR